MTATATDLRPFTMRQLVSLTRDPRQSGLVKRAAATALRCAVAVGDAQDDARRLQVRLDEYARLRPEHERVLIVVCPPLGRDGLPAIEVFCDRRVKVKIAFEDERLPWQWQNFLEEACTPNEVFCLPSWLNVHRDPLEELLTP